MAQIGAVEKFTSESKSDTKIKSTVNVCFTQFQSDAVFLKKSNCKILRGNAIKSLEWGELVLGDLQDAPPDISTITPVGLNT